GRRTELDRRAGEQVGAGDRDRVAAGDRAAVRAHSGDGWRRVVGVPVGGGGGARPARGGDRHVDGAGVGGRGGRGQLGGRLERDRGGGAGAEVDRRAGHEVRAG